MLDKAAMSHRLHNNAITYNHRHLDVTKTEVLQVCATSDQY